MRTGTEWLADLIRRVPIHAINVAAAQRGGDAVALAYVRAIQEWRDEAALAIAETEQQSRRAGSRHQRPDAYARAAAASALLQLDAAE